MFFEVVLIFVYVILSEKINELAPMELCVYICTPYQMLGACIELDHDISLRKLVILFCVPLNCSIEVDPLIFVMVVSDLTR